MAPKNSESAKSEGRCPLLKLVMEKGPLSGRTMDFEPGSSIRVGRIVRGNTISIKDAGISSKHLLIHAELAPDLGYSRWTVKDLGSSNGTFLNVSQLDPSVPAVLTDGDVIKIGEKTAIRVRFEVSGGGSACHSENVKRNPRRRGRNGRVELGVIDENSELGHEGDNQKNRLSLKGMFMIGEDEVLGDHNGNLLAEIEGKGRRTRGSKASKLGIEVKEVGVVESSRKASLRRPKALKKEENLENSEMGIDENEVKSGNVDEFEGKVRRNGGLRTRSSKKEVKLLQESKEIGGVGMQRASTRSTRNSRKVESFDENGVIIEGKSAREGTNGKLGSYVEALLEVKGGNGPTEKGMYSGTEDGTGFGSMSEAKERKSISEELVVDLEKMTLGEWFEFLEIDMPKQIFQVTEKMITEMKQRSVKLHEFMLHQTNAEAIGSAI